MKKTGQALFLILFMLAGSRDSVATDAAGAVPEIHKRINLDPTLDSSKKTDPQSKKKPGWFNRCTQSFYNKVTWMQEYYNTLDPIYQNMIKFGAAGALAGLAYVLYAGSGQTQRPLNTEEIGALHAELQRIDKRRANLQEELSQEEEYSDAAKGWQLQINILESKENEIIEKLINQPQQCLSDMTPGIQNDQNENAQQCSMDDLAAAHTLVTNKQWTTKNIKRLELDILQGKNNAQILEELRIEQKKLFILLKELSVIPKICRDNYTLPETIIGAQSVVNGVLYPSIASTQQFQKFLQNPKKGEELIKAIQKLPVLIKEPLELIDEKLKLSVFIDQMDKWKSLTMPVSEDRYIKLSPDLKELAARLQVLGKTPAFQRLLQASDELKVIISENL